jgi:hypothetical protein
MGWSSPTPWATRGSRTTNPRDRGVAALLPLVAGDGRMTTPNGPEVARKLPLWGRWVATRHPLPKGFYFFEK